jgi:hypothetical protein
MYTFHSLSQCHTLSKIISTTIHDYSKPVNLFDLLVLHVTGYKMILSSRYIPSHRNCIYIINIYKLFDCIYLKCRAHSGLASLLPQTHENGAQQQNDQSTSMSGSAICGIPGAKLRRRPRPRLLLFKNQLDLPLVQVEQVRDTLQTSFPTFERTAINFELQS